MTNAEIDSSDLVLIRRQDTSESGQIVVEFIDDDATLRRYYPEPQKNKIRLHLENDMMEDIYIDQCVIQGIAVKVIKDREYPVRQRLHYFLLAIQSSKNTILC